MLDFSELSSNGEDLELLVRELAISSGYKAHWSGRGPDGGQDLLIEEPGDLNFGAKTRRWLVSCKHMALANGGKGKSVGIDDLGGEGGIVDAVHQHEADGFLLACSTQPSSALVARLAAIERNRRVPTHVWDGVQLERMLGTPRGWQIAQRFMPISADSAGWRIFMTDEPNRFVGITRGYYIQLVNRHGSGQVSLWEIDRVLKQVEAAPVPEKACIRPRGVFDNDKVTAFTWYLDYLHQGRDGEGEESARRLGEYLNSLPDEGIFHHFEVRPRWAHFGGDSHDNDHYRYYQDLPSYFHRSG